MKSSQGRALATALLPGWRCHACRALLLRGVFGPGTHIEIQCRRCGALNDVDARDTDTTPARSS